MGKMLCVEFQRVHLKFNAKYLTHTLKDATLYNVENLRALKFKSSWAFLKCFTPHPHLQPPTPICDSQNILISNFLTDTLCRMMCYYEIQLISTLRRRQNGRHFEDDILKCIFLNENIWILNKISLKIVPQGTINSKALIELKVTYLLMHICITWHQWVKIFYSATRCHVSWVAQCILRLNFVSVDILKPTGIRPSADTVLTSKLSFFPWWFLQELVNFNMFPWSGGMIQNWLQDLQQYQATLWVDATHQWFGARLWYLQCISNGDTTVLH